MPKKTCPPHKYKRKVYEYNIYDFHCVHCDLCAEPDEIERSLNDTEILSAEDAIKASMDSYTATHNPIPKHVHSLKEYAHILSGGGE